MLSGKVILPEGGLIDCRIKDLSDTGARLRLQSVIGVPERFALRIDTMNKTYASETVWRKETEIGVRFA